MPEKESGNIRYLPPVDPSVDAEMSHQSYVENHSQEGLRNYSETAHHALSELLRLSQLPPKSKDDVADLAAMMMVAEAHLRCASDCMKAMVGNDPEIKKKILALLGESNDA